MRDREGETEGGGAVGLQPQDLFTCKCPKELVLIPERSRTTPSSPVRITYPAVTELSAKEAWMLQSPPITTPSLSDVTPLDQVNSCWVFHVVSKTAKQSELHL